jgi:hypothetical protein
MALMAVNIIMVVVEVEISVLVRGSASLSEDYCRTWRRLSGGRRKPGVFVCGAQSARSERRGLALQDAEDARIKLCSLYPSVKE